MRPDAGVLPVVGFGAGGLRFAIEASAVLAMLPEAGAVPAFATLMGLAPADTATRVLLVRQGETAQAIRVEEPVAAIDLPFDAIQPLPPLLAATLRRPAIRALAWDQAGLTILVALEPAGAG